jgi:hypothetical protein
MNHRINAAARCAAIGIVCTASALSANAATPARCADYAKQAVAEFQLASSLPQCRPPTELRWQANYDAHYNGCLLLPEFMLKAEENARLKHLKMCGASTTSAAPSPAAPSPAVPPPAAPPPSARAAGAAPASAEAPAAQAPDTDRPIFAAYAKAEAEATTPNYRYQLVLDTALPVGHQRIAEIKDIVINDAGDVAVLANVLPDTQAFYVAGGANSSAVWSSRTQSWIAAVGQPFTTGEGYPAKLTNVSSVQLTPNGSVRYQSTYRAVNPAKGVGNVKTGFFEENRLAYEFDGGIADAVWTEDGHIVWYGVAQADTGILHVVQVDTNKPGAAPVEMLPNFPVRSVQHFLVNPASGHFGVATASVAQGLGFFVNGVASKPDEFWTKSTSPAHFLLNGRDDVLVVLDQPNTVYINGQLINHVGGVIAFNDKRDLLLGGSANSSADLSVNDKPLARIGAPRDARGAYTLGLPAVPMRGVVRRLLGGRINNRGQVAFVASFLPADSARQGGDPLVVVLATPADLPRPATPAVLPGSLPADDVIPHSLPLKIEVSTRSGTGPPSAPVPWVQGGLDGYTILWGDGNRTAVTVKRFDRERVEFAREDSPGSLIGASRILYTARIDGHKFVDGHMEGTILGRPVSGDWTGTWEPSRSEGPPPAQPAALPPPRSVSEASKAGGGNPLIGKWTAKAPGAIYTASDIEFTPTEQLSQGNRWATQYVTNADTITVVPTGAPPRTCKMISGDEMACQSLVGIDVYVRRK